VFVTSPDDVERLVWNKHCYADLATFLVRKEVASLGKPAIIAKGCDVKAIMVLIQESQIKREDVVILGVSCSGVGDPPLSKCPICDVNIPGEYDLLFGKEVTPKTDINKFADVEEFEKKSPEERWEFWEKQFAKCIKCYACRQVCPLCYCEVCIADRNQPQWIETSAHTRGNYHWNLIRAWHLAGRCIDCQECERACPVGIPLSLLNRKLAKSVKERFDYEPGYDKEVSPPFTDFKPQDSEEFIK
jgi:formate dehydrogenase subunit beta